MTIWKFPLKITDEQVITAPAPFVPLSVQFQRGELCLWAIVDPEDTKLSRRIRICGTGHPAVEWPGGGSFLGTVQHDVKGQTLVWHVFVGGAS